MIILSYGYYSKNSVIVVEPIFVNTANNKEYRCNSEDLFVYNDFKNAIPDQVGNSALLVSQHLTYCIIFVNCTFLKYG